MRNYPGGAKRLDEYTEDDLVSRIDDLKDIIKSKNERIATLESELKRQQEKEEQSVQAAVRNYYPWMCEAIRLRRMCAAVGEELEEYKRRTEKAERGLRNLRKWLEIQGWGTGPSGEVPDKK